jgi:CRISPR-associated protein Cas5a/b/c
MKILVIIAEIHWGYSIKVANIGKAQPALYIPPPSTLIGAISLPLAKHIGHGETISDGRNLFSVAFKYRPMFIGAACKILGGGTYWEDINRNIIALFQVSGSRRLNPKYRFSAVPVGKIYSPRQRIKLLFLVEEKTASQILGEDWNNEIQLAGWELSRIGNKESIISVEQVTFANAEIVDTSQSSTSFYFPRSAVDRIEGEFFYSDFWTDNYQFGLTPQLVKYVIPGTRAPVVKSSTLQVSLDRGVAYTNGEDTIIVNT